MHTLFLLVHILSFDYLMIHSIEANKRKKKHKKVGMCMRKNEVYRYHYPLELMSL